MAQKEAEKNEQDFGRYFNEEKNLKKSEKGFEDKVGGLSKIEEEKRSRSRGKRLILKKVCGVSLQRTYLGAEEKQIVSHLKNLDKYQISLETIGTEREKSAKQLAKFLNGLGYSK